MTAIALTFAFVIVAMKAIASSLADSTALVCLSIALSTSSLGSRLVTLRSASSSTYRLRACESSRSVTAPVAPWLLPSLRHTQSACGRSR